MVDMPECDEADMYAEFSCGRHASVKMPAKVADT
jgi:hypothetical protein